MEIAETYTRSYFEDMDALGIVRPDISPRATGHIIEQIEIIKMLLQKGFAYEADGSVYFDVAKHAAYGKLSGRSTEEMEAGTRVDLRGDKRHPNDFALWKKAEPAHIMRWPSPWGVGFPGWHIECSAMSMKYLGDTFDIHGGGLDNQFPHHECEIAQSECATGKPFVRYWLHNNLVTVGGQKMSKSLGNVILLKDAFKRYDPLVIRLFVLQSHYRSTLDFTEEALDGAAKGLEKLHNTVRNLREELARRTDDGAAAGEGAQPTTDVKALALAAMDDDFNTPQAIAVLFDLSREVNVLLSLGNAGTAALRRADGLFREFGGTILGIIPDQFGATARGSAAIEEELAKLLVEVRGEGRAARLWTLSDKIRDGLSKLGIVLEDKKGATTWRRSQKTD